MESHTIIRSWASHVFSHYGMLVVLGLLCIFFSVLTISDHQVSGADAALRLSRLVQERLQPDAAIVIVSRVSQEDSLFTRTLGDQFSTRGHPVLATISGSPAAIRAELQKLLETAQRIDLLVTLQPLRGTVASVFEQNTTISVPEIITPPARRWPTFLLPDNLRNVANQIAVIAIIAIGMTMVIIAGGIDLSVGSLIALSAVTAAWMIGHFGGESASGLYLFLSCMVAIAITGVTGAFSGLMITAFSIPPFIATLAMMQVAAGVAYIISKGMPIYAIPAGFVWLGRGAEPLLRIPYAVVLTAVLYAAAHVAMTRTTFGRYIYAVGGNIEAARLAGVRVKRVQLGAYTLSGVLAGLGGVVMASQLKSGAPTYGAGYELHVIAAVVVGGTSLSGGEGRVFGTLIGALMIGVIQNGMNLMNVESYTQKVVLGLVILAAVLFDQLRHRGVSRFLSRQLSR